MLLIKNKLGNNINELKNDSITLSKMLEKSWNSSNYINYKIYDENGYLINLHEISLNKPILIFRFSKLDCSKCIIGQMDIMNDIKKENLNYLFLANYSNKRNLGLFKRVNRIDTPIYECKQLLRNEISTPYFCVYHNNKALDIFFPDDDFPHLTKTYLNIVKRKYFDENDFEQ